MECLRRCLRCVTRRHRIPMTFYVNDEEMFMDTLETFTFFPFYEWVVERTTRGPGGTLITRRVVNGELEQIGSASTAGGDR